MQKWIYTDRHTDTQAFPEGTKRHGSPPRHISQTKMSPGATQTTGVFLGRAIRALSRATTRLRYVIFGLWDLKCGGQICTAGYPHIQKQVTKHGGVSKFRRPPHRRARPRPLKAEAQILTSGLVFTRVPAVKAGKVELLGLYGLSPVGSTRRHDLRRRAIADEATTDGALGDYTCGVFSHDRHVQERPSDFLSPSGSSVRDIKVNGAADMVQVVCVLSLVGAASAAV